MASEHPADVKIKGLLSRLGTDGRKLALGLIRLNDRTHASTHEPFALHQLCCACNMLCQTFVTLPLSLIALPSAAGRRLGSRRAVTKPFQPHLEVERWTTDMEGLSVRLGSPVRPSVFLASKKQPCSPP